jgi:hypothetical protein
VLDFGIAKLEQQTDSSTRLTQDGAVLGSPGYFSPEQARGETDIDFRTDIWSICVVLYELITGELPFAGPNYNALLMSILKDTPKSIMTYGYGDEALWRIVQRGLQRDRDQRWGSMWELGRELAAWLHAKGVRADAASRSLEEMWLEVRGSEQAPPLQAGFVKEGVPRRALSTLIKRRVTDTFAGETISTASSQRRVSTRLIGWSAAAFGVCTIGLSALLRGPSTPGVHAGATTATASSAEPTALLPPPSEAAAKLPPSNSKRPPPIASALPVNGVADALSGTSPPKKAASSSDGRPKVSERTSAPATPDLPRQNAVAHNSRVAAVDAARARRSAAAAARPRTPGRKAIDQEFGF